MPLYDVQCTACETKRELMRSLARFSEPITCDCGGAMRMLVSAPRVMSDITEYKSLMDGKMITSRSHHREHMKAHDVVELGDAPPRSMEPEKYHRDVDWSQATAEAAEQITQTRGAKWLKDNLT